MKYKLANNETRSPGNYEGICGTLYSDIINRPTQEVPYKLNYYDNSSESSSVKQYRSFSNSTNVTPIENPIILNPNYNDLLPAQYTIDRFQSIDELESKRREKELAVKIIVEKLKNVQSRRNDKSITYNKTIQKQNYVPPEIFEKFKNENIEENKTQYEQEMKIGFNKADNNSDLQSIKMTAFNIIDENIKKAVSVAEQIKMEIDVELIGKKQCVDNRESRNVEKKNLYDKTEQKIDYFKTLGEKYAYSLGIQSIPYMKTYMESSSFKSILIKQIFLQLTMFMVSLSRHLESTRFFKTRSNYGGTNTREDVFKDEELLNGEKLLSGSEMSRKYGKTPLEFTKRMDTVITEFEARTGLEQSSKIQRRSRSRSHSTINEKVLYENMDDKIKSETDSNNFYRAFVTEEWSEYYNLGPEKRTSTKTEKHFESKTMKKETVEKFIQEKKTENLMPLTYIAIVHAHAFINQDAIHQDTLCEAEYEENKLISTDILKSTEESTVRNEKERNVSYTDLENQVIIVNKEQPFEKVVVVESIEDITPIEEHKSFADMERVVSKVAVQTTTDVLEPITEISEHPFKLVQAKSSMDTPNIIIASNEAAVVILEEKENIFTLPEIKPRKSVTLFEPSLKIVAESTEIDIIEPRVEILEISDDSPAKIYSKVEEQVKQIAEISEVQISEAQTQPLQIHTSKKEQFKNNVETPVKVAEKFEIFMNDSIQEFKKNAIETTTPKVTTQSLNTIIAETKEAFIDEAFGVVEKMECDQKILQLNIEQPIQTVAETTVPLMDESNGLYEKGKLDIRRPQILIETPTKVVAETCVPLLNETSNDFVQKLTDTSAPHVSIEGTFKTVANKMDIFSGECNLGQLKKLEIEGETTTSSIEKSFIMVPETTEVYLNEITEIIKTPKYNDNNFKILIETPINTVAEMTEVFVDKLEFEHFSSDKITTEKPNVVIETPTKVIAEQSVIITDAPKPHGLEIAEFKMETPKTFTEDSLRFLSTSIIPAIEEPRIESIKTPKILNEEAKVVLGKIDPLVTTEVFLAEPKQISFEIPEVNSKISKPLMEDAQLTVPETVTTSVQGPKDDFLLVSKVAEEYAKINFRSSKATGVSEVSILEPQCDSLEVLEIKQQQYQTSLENINKVVPNIQVNVVLGPKDDILIIPNTVSSNAYLKINELKALDTSQVIPEEAMQKPLEPFQMKVKQPKVFIEDYNKTVPLNTHMRVAESEKIFSVSSESFGRASPTVQPLSAVAQSAVIPIEEVRVSAKSKKTPSNKVKISLREFSTPKITQMTALSTVKQEEFRVSQDLKKADVILKTAETAKAEVNKVDVKESKLEITEITDSEDTYEDVSVNYNVELVKDEIHDKKLSEIKQTVEAQHLHDVTLKSCKQGEAILFSAIQKSAHVKTDTNHLEDHGKSIVNLVEADFKSLDKNLFVQSVSESKLIESESSKSPSPTSPINDVYLFSVATPYTKHETQTEIPCVELDYRSDVKKREYTQAEISVEESIAIELQASDSEDEIQSIEMDYEYQKHHLEYTSNINEAISRHQKEQSLLEFDQSISKQESNHSHAHVSHSKSIRESLQEGLHVDTKEIHQNKKSKFNKSTTAHADRSNDIQALEINRQFLQKDIKVIESDLESSRALLLTVDTSTSINKDVTGESKQINHKVKSPSPPVQPPTPLTDEYMFRLTAPLISREGTPVPRDCTSSSESEEDIVKQKLIPHIELTIEQKIYDPPLPTPPTSPPVTSASSIERRRPFYSKPGLRGGGDRAEISKEEDLEIRRKSTLLASAIDKTIKSIEEYKSEVGMEAVNVDYESSSEIKTCSSSSESNTIREFKTLVDDNKVEVLIDEIVETSRRFSGEGSERDDLKPEENDDIRLNANEKVFIVPIQREDTEATRTDSQSERVTEDTEKINKMDTNKLSEQLLQTVQSMVDPNASIEERLAQMQAQIIELSRLPVIIHRTLDAVKIQFEELNHEMQQKAIEIQMSQNVNNESDEQTQVSDEVIESLPSEQPVIAVTESVEVGKETQEASLEPVELPPMEKPDDEIQRIIENRRLEAENKEREEIMKERLSQELRIAADRLSPRLGVKPELVVPQKPSPKYDISGPMVESKPSSGKIWKKLDNYDDNNLEQMLSETLAAQAEVIKGNAIGVNFMKYEKPPHALDHLQNSEVYKAIHDVDQKPLKKVELLRPAIAASDYVQRLRSVSPSPAKSLIEDCEV